MLENTLYQAKLNALFGKTIAIVYVFEGDCAKGYTHYDAWHGDVISTWIKGVEELHCLPFLLDIRTFVQKGMNNTLPHLDYVINLNNGTNELSTLGFVPSVCSFLGIPCIPSDTLTTVSGENKRLSNIIAESVGLRIPQYLPLANTNGIRRPISLGSSLGVKRGAPSSLCQDEYIYQQFIEGIDTTTAILYNPLTEQLEVLPTILYYPNQKLGSWFLGEEEKMKHMGYEKKIVSISPEAEKRYLKMAYTMGITCFGRIDARLSLQKDEDVTLKVSNPIDLSQLYFLEINPMPTIKDGINFYTAMDSLIDNTPLATCYDFYRMVVKEPSHTGFLLSCAMLSKIKAKR